MLKRLFALSSLTIVQLCATIEVPPAPIEDRFAQAEVVCSGVAIDLEGPHDWPERDGEALPVDYMATVSLESQYKGEALPRRFRISFRSISPFIGPPLAVGTRAIFFLQRGPDKSVFQLLAAPGAAIPLMKDIAFRPAQPGGLTTLEADLMGSADSQNASVALEILLQFRRLRPDTIQAIRSLHSPDPDANVLRLVILALANSPHGQSATYAISSPKDSARLPFLIEQLDSPDQEIQYSALITLAQITGKTGDYAPTMHQFRQDPKRYVTVWKQWWSE